MSDMNDRIERGRASIQDQINRLHAAADRAERRWQEQRGRVTGWPTIEEAAQALTDMAARMGKPEPSLDEQAITKLQERERGENHES